MASGTVNPILATNTVFDCDANALMGLPKLGHCLEFTREEQTMTLMLRDHEDYLTGLPKETGVVEACSPLATQALAVEGMKGTKDLGEDQEQWEEQARNKARDMILAIIGRMLFVGDIGAVLTGSATLGRFALIAGESANMTFRIHEMVDSPDTALMGLYCGTGKFARSPSGFKNMAAKRVQLRTTSGVSKIGGNVQHSPGHY